MDSQTAIDNILLSFHV